MSYGDDQLDAFSVVGTTVDVELLLRTITESTEAVAERWDIEASVHGSPVAMLTVDSPATTPSVLTINVLINQAPEVQLTEPFAGQRVMEGDSIRASATFTDDMDGADALVFLCADCRNAAQGETSPCSTSPVPPLLHR